MTVHELPWPSVACAAAAGTPALAQEPPADTDILQEYRITAYPSYRIATRLRASGTWAGSTSRMRGHPVLPGKGRVLDPGNGA